MIGLGISVDRLWRGCVLATIAHALCAARNGGSRFDRIWIDGCYFRDNGSGDRGVVAFVDGQVAAGFFGHESWRSPYRAEGTSFDYLQLLMHMPNELRVIFDNVIVRSLSLRHSAITAAFWSAGGLVQAEEPWAAINKHGGDILDIELSDINTAIKALTAHYDLISAYAPILEAVFNRRMNTDFGKNIELLPSEIHTVLHAELDPTQQKWGREWYTSERDLNDMQRVLLPLNIIVPTL